MSVEETDVLIVGAGPAGLVAAAALARHGLVPLLVERRAGALDHPRATVVSTRSMELLRAWGLEDEVLAGALDVECGGWVCETLSGEDGFAVSIGLPSREQSAAISPTRPACVPQDHLEPVLERYARGLGARVELGTELTGLRVRSDGVMADLGGGRRVHARYLVGADGVHSTVRRLLEIPTRGPGVLEAAVAAVLHGPLWRLVGARRYSIYPVTHPAASGLFLPAGRDDRWIYVLTRDPAEFDAGKFGAGALTRLIRLAAGDARLAPRIRRIGPFKFAAWVADRFRDGSAFLVGDAAHRATPRGATGMNTAIADGYDLGWKLAWVLRGWAPASLLDSYEAERRPVAEHTVARSARSDGAVREPAAELHVDLGARIPHMWLGERRSTLDLLGLGLTRLAGPACNGRAGRSRAPIDVRRLPAVAAAALGIPAGGSLLLRPDGVPVRASG
jgi:putative polyketide hydroxylase